MNTLIKNPSAHSKRTAERLSGRRRRPIYPTMEAGKGTYINRIECGENRPIWDGKGKLNTLLGKFVFIRALHRASTSKYTPHEGDKQLAKKGQLI